MGQPRGGAADDIVTYEMTACKRHGGSPSSITCSRQALFETFHSRCAIILFSMDLYKDWMRGSPGNAATPGEVIASSSGVRASRPRHYFMPSRVRRQTSQACCAGLGHCRAELDGGEDAIKAVHAGECLRLPWSDARTGVLLALCLRILAHAGTRAAEGHGSPFRGFPRAAAAPHGTPKLSYRMSAPAEQEAVHSAMEQLYLSPDAAAAGAGDDGCTPLRAGLRQLPGLQVRLATSDRAYNARRMNPVAS